LRNAASIVACRSSWKDWKILLTENSVYKLRRFVWLAAFGGGGRTFRIGSQPVSAVLSASCNVEQPTGRPVWNIRLLMTFLFPR